MTIIDPLPLFPEVKVGNGSPLGVIGHRQLTVTQTFQIGRLTSHPIQLVPGSFVAVHGRGPRRDSNGSGKTTWLAAVSLILGDPQWRLHSGGTAAADLLFAPTAAGLRVKDYRSPDHGFIVGVFTQSEKMPITVWLRINSSAPYLKVKWTEGVHLVEGASDVRRHVEADRLWAEVATDSSALGSSTYPLTLYGPTPRCLAWVQKRGRMNPGPSLLHTSAGEFRPEEIGQALIELTGKAEMLSRDVEVRKRLADHVDKHGDMQRRFDEAYQREQEQLDQVNARNQARELLAGARGFRRRYDAVGLVEVLDRAKEIDEDELPGARSNLNKQKEKLADAEIALVELQRRASQEDSTEKAKRERDLAQEEFEAIQKASAKLEWTKEQLEEERARMSKNAAHDDGTKLGVLREQAATAAERHEESVRVDAVAESLVDQARTQLEAARRGEAGGVAGALIARLREQGIGAQRLLDAVTLDAAVRDQWEARLQPLHEAVVVAHADQEQALSTAQTLPGAILISAPAGSLPDGISDAPEEATALLVALEQRLAATDDAVVAALDVGLHLIGGFDTPITGREASIRASESKLTEAEALADVNSGELRKAKQELEEAERRLACGEAGARTAEINRQLSNLAKRLADMRKVEARFKEEVERANDRLADAKAAISGIENLISSQEFQIQHYNEKVKSAEEEVRELVKSRAELRIDYWKRRWTGNEAEARGLVVQETLSRSRLRTSANGKLQDIQVKLELTNEGEGAPTREIRAGLRDRFGTSDDDNEGERSDSTFDKLADALGDWLDTTAEQDQIAEARINEDRKSRALQLETVERELGGIREQLEVVQDAIEETIERALKAISAKLDELDRGAEGFGADLLISAARPANPEDTWTWSVTPRWRRRSDGDLIAYTEQINTAREKLFTIHLVLAALLASAEGTVSRGQVLILDELGDSLGDQHRRDVMSALQGAAGAHGITILGTCQDSVLDDAARVCGEILYFVHATESDALNHPTRMFGFDPDRNRRELAVDTATIGRPVR
jgi:hypothetical protein